MTANHTASEQVELSALRELSARIGRNPLLAQASSGNTSVKIDDVLWIKASGKWLVHAKDDDFFTSVKVAKARRLARVPAVAPEPEINAASVPGSSIETTMHAVLPHKVVVHVHSVNTIAWAVREDAPRQLGLRLADLPWQWIPYTPSGIPLARRVEGALAVAPKANVFVLGNHGLVVCGDSCESVERLLNEVECRLCLEPRNVPPVKPSLLRNSASTGAWRLPDCERVHAFATDHVSRRILSGGILYPCQAIFLPELMILCAAATKPIDANNGHIGNYCGRYQQMLRLIEDQGVLTSAHITQAEREMLAGLAQIVQRIDASAPLRYLTASEITEVLNVEAENYRRSADTNSHSKTSNLL